MNREIYQPAFIGIIIIWFMMSLSFHFPIIPIIFSISFFYTIKFICPPIVTRYFMVLSISILISSLGVLRLDLEKNKYYIPINKKSIISADLCVTKDSIPVSGGFLSTGKIIGVNSNQLYATAKDNIIVFSKNEFLSGLILKNVKIKWKNGCFESSIKNNFFDYSSKYYKLRSQLINYIKFRSGSPLLMALLTGNKSGLDIFQIDLFRKTGCSHILALSGFHVGIITIMLLLLLRLFITGNYVYIISVLVLVIYLVIVGVTPSLLRSVLMFIIGIIFKVKRSKNSILNMLIISFYIIVLFMPSEFYTLSFKLSYLALFGILTIGSEINNLFFFNRLPKLLKLPISTSLSAMISTFWIIFPLFGVLYPVGVIASIVLTPIITIYIWVGILRLVIPYFSIVTNFLEKMIYFILNFFSKSPVIENSGINSSFVTLIMVIIPVILVILKIYRRTDARRFNLKFKL